MSIARKQGKRNRFEYTARGKGIKINSASRADREWAEWNESQKWMTRWGRLTFCSFYSNSRELIRKISGFVRFFLLSMTKKHCFKTLKFDLFKGRIFIRNVWAFEVRRTIYSRRKEYKLGGDCGTAVLVSCAKTVRNEDRQKRNAKQWSSLSFDARKQSLLHCEFFRIPQHFVVFAHIDLRVDTNKHY